MTEDHELLSRYATEQSEAAFAELTGRYVDLVYSAALRLMNGDVHTAQDVTQQVFSEVARQAKRLAHHPALVGWLYTTTRLLALRAHRTEQRRKAREMEVNTMNELLHGGDDAPADWTQLGPVIEDAMHELDDKDRVAVLLRYFQNKTLHEVGTALNLSENAARMRVGRALDKLRGKLARRGITTTAAALGAAVSTHAVEAAPAGFAATLSGAALAGSAVPASTLIVATKTIAMTTMQKTVVAAALAAAVGTGFYAVHRQAQLTSQIHALEQQQAPLNAQLQSLELERAQTARQLAALTEENARLKTGSNTSELLKLRGEVGPLRQRVAASEAKAAQPAGGLAQMMSDPAMKEFMLKAMKDKMKLLYADFIQEMKLTPEQADQLLEVLTSAGSRDLAQLAASSGGARNPAPAEPPQDAGKQLLELLGPAGAARFKDFSDEVPARVTLSLLKDQPGAAPLSAEQNANLIRVIKAEPVNLTCGIVGGPDKAFLGSPAEIERFLAQVGQSNQRILQQAGGFLAPDQLSALENVLNKGIQDRRLQGAAFFRKQ